MIFSSERSQCYARFVNLRNLQNVLRNSQIAHAQFANFWPKLNPNLNLILALAKSRSAFCKLRRLTNCAQQQ